MATDRAFVDYLLELLDSIPGVMTKRMFGGYGIFRDGLMFGLVSDATFYLKVDEETRAAFVERELAPFSYEAKGKTMTLSYYEAPGEVLDNSDDMVEWAELAYGAALRAHKR